MAIRTQYGEWKGDNENQKSAMFEACTQTHIVEEMNWDLARMASHWIIRTMIIHVAVCTRFIQLCTVYRARVPLLFARAVNVANFTES